MGSVTGPRIAMGAIGALATSIVGYEIHLNLRPQEIAVQASPQQPLTMREVQEVETRFRNGKEPMVHAYIVDFSGSYAEPQGPKCHSQCKGMRDTAIVQCRRDLGDLLAPGAALPGNTVLVFGSLGTSSLDPDALWRVVDIRYPLPPTIPPGWDRPDAAEHTSEQLGDITAAIVAWKQWRSTAEQVQASKQKEIEDALATFKERRVEGVTDIVSVAERLMRQSTSERFTSAWTDVRLYTDLEEALGGRPQHPPHTDAELAAWCGKNGLSFAPHTRVTINVSTRSGTLQALIARWKPFFVNCKIGESDLTFMPLSREDVAHK